MSFRTLLLRTLQAVQPVLLEPGVLVAGSEVPNLLEPDARCSLLISRDLDLAVPVGRHAAVEARLREMTGLRRSEEEPSVWLPVGADLMEVDFIGMDTRGERVGETHVLEDSELPLLEPHVQMPDPTPHRALLAGLLARLESGEPER